MVTPRSDVTVLAVAIDVDSIAVALVDLGGVVIDQRRRLHQPASHHVRRVVETVAQMALELLALPESGRCLGVGVSVPGAVRTSDGLVRFAPNLGWHDEPFTALLVRRARHARRVRQRLRPRVRSPSTPAGPRSAPTTSRS